MIDLLKALEEYMPEDGKLPLWVVLALPKIQARIHVRSQPESEDASSLATFLYGVGLGQHIAKRSAEDLLRDYNITRKP